MVIPLDVVTTDACVRSSGVATNRTRPRLAIEYERAVQQRHKSYARMQPPSATLALAFHSTGRVARLGGQRCLPRTRLFQHNKNNRRWQIPPCELASCRALGSRPELILCVGNRF